MKESEQMPIQENLIIEFADLRGVDLSREDLREIPLEILRKTDFDTETIWPEKDKLPQGFCPEAILEEGKNPGLGIRELHKQGINGQGIIVAIIDQKLDINHSEYRDSILDYKEYDSAKDEDISMHGPAVASLLVGKDCGVAPGAKLVYRAVPSGRDFTFRAEALNDIIDKIKQTVQKV